MVRQFGIATFFVTLSAAETKWEELLVILSRNVDDKVITLDEAKKLEFREKSRLIRKDPVTCAQYFDHRFKTIFKLFKSKTGIFDEHFVTHFYYRIEFQHRGSPHVHAIFWCKDAPILNTEDPESFGKVTDFIDRYRFVTCDSSIEGLEEFIPYQMHSHGANCNRMFKGKKYCKYNYPMPPMRKTTILLPLELEEINDNVIKNCAAIQSFLHSKIDNDNLTFDDFLQLPQINLSEADYITAIRSSIKKIEYF